jgi:branched-subunit amino acid transport protein AzlD
MIDVHYVTYVIAAMAVVTFALRALPFLAAPWLRKHPVVRHLGQFLPLAIMTLLLLHSLVGIAKEHDAGPWPELLAAALVALLQWTSRNPLLSIVAGTTAYVALRNMNML